MHKSLLRQGSGVLYPAHSFIKMLKKWIWKKQSPETELWGKCMQWQISRILVHLSFQVEEKGSTGLQQMNTFTVRKYSEFFSIVEKGTSLTSDWKLKPNNLINSRFSTSYCLLIKIPIFLEDVSAKCKLLHLRKTGWNPTDYNSQGVRAEDLIASFGFKASAYKYSWFSGLQRYFSSTMHAQH